MANNWKLHIRLPYEQQKRKRKEIVGESLTEDHHAEGCDVNRLMAKYVKTGLVPQRDASEGLYMDCPSYDFATAQNLIKNAERQFMELPANLRERYKNDIGAFVAALESEDGVTKDEVMELLGIPGKVEPVAAEVAEKKEEKKLEKELD